MVSSEIDAPGRYTAPAKFPVTTAAIPAVNLVSLEEYLSTVYEPDAEFVDDVIEERAARRRQSFRVAGGPLQLLLHAGIELEPARAPLAPYPGVGKPLPGPRRRSPQSRCPRQQIATHPPLAIFEIPSSEDRHKLLLVRPADFERMGVPSIYVIDPEDGDMLRFHAGVLAPETRIHIPARGVDIARVEIATLVRWAPALPHPRTYARHP